MLSGLLSGVRTYRSRHGTAAFYSLSSVAKAAAQVVTGLVLARYIAPSDLGLWNSISVALTYSVFLQTGVLSGLTRELPFTLGAGDRQKAEKLAGTSQTFTVIGCAMAALMGFGALGAFGGRGDKMLYSIAAITIVIVTTFYNNYLTITFRSDNSFYKLSIIQFVVAGLSLATVPMFYFWSYEGMLGRIALLSVAWVLLLHLVRPMRVAMSWDWKSFSELLMTGLPMFTLTYLDMTSVTADRMALLKFGGVEDVGYYSLGLMIWQGLATIPLSLTNYLYPRMTYKYGKGESPENLWNTAFRATLVVVAIMLPMVVAGWYLLPVVIPWLFPKYVPGIHSAQLLLWVALFSMATIGVNLLWSMKSWKYLIGYQLTAIVLKVAGPFAGAYFFSKPLEGVSYGLIAAYGLSFIIGVSLTYSATHGRVAAAA